jgi:hypothetical protein
MNPSITRGEFKTNNDFHFWEWFIIAAILIYLCYQLAS